MLDCSVVLLKIVRCRRGLKIKTKNKLLIVEFFIELLKKTYLVVILCKELALSRE